MIVSITKIGDKLDSKTLRSPHLGIFLFQGKYFDRLTDRMVFREILSDRNTLLDITGLKNINFSNNIFENNYYLLINFRNVHNKLSQVSYKVNSDFPQPSVNFIPEELGTEYQKYILNGNKLVCDYKILTGYTGHKILLKNMRINYGITEKLKIHQIKKLDFDEEDLDKKTIVLEDYYSVKGNLYRIIMEGRNGWRLQPRMSLTNFKFLDSSDESKKRMKV